MRCQHLLIGLSLFLPCLSLHHPATADETDVAALLTTIRAVGPEAKGHAEAIRAHAKLARVDAARLCEVLAGFDNAGPLAANWIRAAVDTIAERQLQRGGKLPQAALERFLADTRHAPRARRLAYEWIVHIDPFAGDRLLPNLLNDPSAELRRDAVSLTVRRAKTLAGAEDKGPAVAMYRKALDAARDLDLVDLIVKRLGELGETVDLPRHFGLLMQWKLIGPFDNRQEGGFDVAYPPEKGFDPSAKYAGRFDSVAWQSHTTTDAHGVVDLKKVIGPHKGVLVYALAEFVSQREQPVQIRMGTYNANKIWLNGRLLAANEIYHAGERFDQYVVEGTMRQGRNLLLLKICQNEQTEHWAQNWRFQLRVCDSQGRAILSEGRGGEE